MQPLVVHSLTERNRIEKHARANGVGANHIFIEGAEVIKKFLTDLLGIVEIKRARCTLQRWR